VKELSIRSATKIDEIRRMGGERNLVADGVGDWWGNDSKGKGM
jgi:hypothetical protein